MRIPFRLSRHWFLGQRGGALTAALISAAPVSTFSAGLSDGVRVLPSGPPPILSFCPWIEHRASLCLSLSLPPTIFSVLSPSSLQTRTHYVPKLKIFQPQLPT